MIFTWIEQDESLHFLTHSLPPHCYLISSFAKDRGNKFAFKTGQVWEPAFQCPYVHWVRQLSVWGKLHSTEREALPTPHLQSAVKLGETEIRYREGKPETWRQAPSFKSFLRWTGRALDIMLFFSVKKHAIWPGHLFYDSVGVLCHFSP